MNWPGSSSSSAIPPKTHPFGSFRSFVSVLFLSSFDHCSCGDALPSSPLTSDTVRQRKSCYYLASSPLKSPSAHEEAGLVLVLRFDEPILRWTGHYVRA